MQSPVRWGSQNEHLCPFKATYVLSRRKLYARAALDLVVLARHRRDGAGSVWRRTANRSRAAPAEQAAEEAAPTEAPSRSPCRRRSAAAEAAAPAADTGVSLTIWADEQRASILNFDLGARFFEQTGVRLVVVQKAIGNIHADFITAPTRGASGHHPRCA